MRLACLLFFSFVFLWADAHILVYHRFNDARHPTTSVTNENLREHFDYLKKNDFIVVPLKVLVKKLQNGENIPDKWVALTIDDGYKSFGENGLEIFKEFGYPFTVFVYVEATDKKYSDFLTWDELKAITLHGDVEFHSYAHLGVGKVDEEILKKDFQKGIAIFEKKMGYKPTYFSYPYGEFTEQTQNITKTFGFSAILNQNKGATNFNSDVFNLDRSAIVENVNIKNILKQKVLETKWEEPTIYPKNGNLTKVVVMVKSDAKVGELYITNIGWRYVEIKNNQINEEINEKIKGNRVRVILKIGDYISTKILVKE